MNDVLKLVKTDPKTRITIWKLRANNTGLKMILSDVKNLSYNPYWDLLNWSYTDTDPKSTLRLPKWVTMTMVKVKTGKTILSGEVETGAAYKENVR